MKPGESDCGLCLLRPKDEGGNGACPYRLTIKTTMERTRDCRKFREGDYVPKNVKPQEEALF
jgi:hypothetical protein